MTVTVESYYGESVDVLVHRTDRKDNWYSREITLVTSQSRRIVQYGIVRLNIDTLETEVWQQIESEEVPLGRVLIQHNVLREVELCELWKINAGPCLAAMLHRSIGEAVYGRTALIHCDGEPAIELLEIVAPIANG
jgi:chorismate-pyruvate lyase